ncbi:MAG TPA: hypothetical protein PLZ95_19145, partial [Bryobacteraceae bacterium]|nr:hypothetical protein [Bryobacteraceae bacterium]
MSAGPQRQRGRAAAQSTAGLILKTMALLLAVVALAPAVSAASPALFFSDLDWGPKTGWEGSATKGAAV